MKSGSYNTEAFLIANESTGTVHLEDRRVLLLDADSLRRMRDRLFDTQGNFEAARMLWNFCYANGFQDAIAMKRSFSKKDKSDWLRAAAGLLERRGFSKVERINSFLTRKAGERLFEVEWTNSWEISLDNKPSEESTRWGCGTIAGYLSGFASAVTGENMLLLETKCQARGDDRCFGTAKSEWSNDDDEVHIVQSFAENAAREKFDLNAFIADNTATIEKIQQLLTEIEAQKAEIHALQTQVQYLVEIGTEGKPIHEMIGTSPEYKKALRDAQRVAATDSTVLIQGETGTGKELFARYIHANSTLKNRPLITVNCAALPASLVESELFGHEKGAFTGAVQRKPGRFEIADGGTIFLDEIGEIPLETQVKFLRVLQEGEFERVGGTQTIKVNVRLLAATNQNLDELVREGKFRADLFYRLNVFPISVPPLRERSNDLVMLINYFAQKYRKQFHKPLTSVSQSSIDELKHYEFPGNVRELQHLVERSVLLSEGEVLEILVPPGKGRVEAAATYGSNDLVTFEEMERRYLETVLRRTNHVIAGKGGAAELLGLPPSTLRSRMKRLGIK